MISLIKKKGINPQDKSTLYFPQWTRVSTVHETQLAKRMARGSTFSVGEINGVFADFPQSIIDELLNGNAVSHVQTEGERQEPEGEEGCDKRWCQNQRHL